MPSYGAARNPVDLTAQVSAGGVVAALDAILSAGVVDGLVLVVPMASSIRLRSEPGLGPLLAASDVPIALYSYTRPSADGVALLNELGLPFYTSPRRVARVMRALAEAGRVAATPPPPAGSTSAAPGPSLRATPGWPGPWPEHPAKELLRAWSLPVPPGELAGDASAAIAAAARIGYPVALKVQSPDLPHKSDIGALALGLASAEAVGAAYERLVQRVGAAAPDARLTGVLVEAMAGPGHAMIIGALVDPDFGPLVMLGTGGVHAEVLADTAFALAPLSAEAAVGLVDRVRGSVLLRGLRGEPPADRAALEQLLVAFSELAVACRDDFADIDLNPVLVHPAGQGVTVVDAWITGRPG
jgi:acetyltransferase